MNATTFPCICGFPVMVKWMAMESGEAKKNPNIQVVTTVFLKRCQQCSRELSFCLRAEETPSARREEVQPH